MATATGCRRRRLLLFHGLHRRSRRRDRAARARARRAGRPLDGRQCLRLLRRDAARAADRAGADRGRRAAGPGAARWPRERRNIDSWRMARTQRAPMASIDEAVRRLRKNDPRLDEALARRVAEVGTRPTEGVIWKLDPRTAPPGRIRSGSTRCAIKYWQRSTCPVLFVDGADSRLNLAAEERAWRRALRQQPPRRGRGRRFPRRPASQPARRRADPRAGPADLTSRLRHRAACA